MSEAPSDRELLWRRYNMHVDLYKYYFDIAIKVNVFFYAVTGGILSYYFANPSRPLLKYSLLLPIAVSSVLAFLFINGSRLLKPVQTDLNTLVQRLHFDAVPNIRVLITTCSLA